MHVEIHRISHLQVRNWDRGLARHNALMIAGGGLLVFSSCAIRRESQRVADALFRMLGARTIRRLRS